MARDPRPAPINERARALVLAHGWNTTAYQILNPGIRHWFSAAGDAVVGYVPAGRTRVVAGAPVCAPERLPDVVGEWEAEAGRTCYFGAESRLRDELMRTGDHTAAILGAQPVWSPEGFVKACGTVPSLRAQLHRARNKGVTVRPESDLASLRGPLDEWLETRGLPPLHFLVEPETFGAPDDRVRFVARRNGVPIGFLTLAPIPTRQGWLTEQFVRGRDAPNGTVESLLHAGAAYARDQGDRLYTMGISPLARGPEPENPAWLQLVTRWSRAHGRRFYDFDGLSRFKAKFRPERWEPIYVISREPRFSLGTLWAVLAAFSQGSPALLLAKGLGRALRTEGRNLIR